jgi:hypothetical protein
MRFRPHSVQSKLHNHAKERAPAGAEPLELSFDRQEYRSVLIATTFCRWRARLRHPLIFCSRRNSHAAASSTESSGLGIDRWEGPDLLQDPVHLLPQAGDGRAVGAHGFALPCCRVRRRLTSSRPITAATCLIAVTSWMPLPAARPVRGSSSTLSFIWGAKQIHAVHECPIIFLTGDMRPEAVQRMLEDRPAAVLNKPFSEADLKRALAKVLHVAQDPPEA